MLKSTKNKNKITESIRKYKQRIKGRESAQSVKHGTLDPAYFIRFMQCYHYQEQLVVKRQYFTAQE